MAEVTDPGHCGVDLATDPLEPAARGARSAVPPATMDKERRASEENDTRGGGEG